MLLSRAKANTLESSRCLFGSCESSPNPNNASTILSSKPSSDNCTRAPVRLCNSWLGHDTLGPNQGRLSQKKSKKSKVLQELVRGKKPTEDNLQRKVPQAQNKFQVCLVSNCMCPLRRSCTFSPFLPTKRPAKSPATTTLRQLLPGSADFHHS